MKKKALPKGKKQAGHPSVAMLQPFRIELSGNCEMDAENYTGNRVAVKMPVQAVG